MKLLLGVFTMLALSGCAIGRMDRIDSMNCVPENKLSEAVVVVSIDPKTGQPMATPDRCHVKGGAKVVFQTTSNARSNFTVRFDKGDGSPAADDARTFSGVPAGARGFAKPIPAVKPALPGRPQEFRYSIEIDGRKSDPSIIIDQ